LDKSTDTREYVKKRAQMPRKQNQLPLEETKEENQGRQTSPATLKFQQCQSSANRDQGKLSTVLNLVTPTTRLQKG